MWLVWGGGKASEGRWGRLVTEGGEASIWEDEASVEGALTGTIPITNTIPIFPH